MDRRHYARSSPPGLAFVKIEPGMGGTMVDLCEGGLGFRVIMPLLDEEGPVKVSFSLDANSLLEASGELAWSDATKQSGGVRFTNIRDDVKAQLRDFLAKSILSVQPSEPVFPAPYLSTLSAALSSKQIAQATTANQAPQKSNDAPAISAPAAPPKTPTSRPMVVLAAKSNQSTVTGAPAAATNTPPKRAVPMKPRTSPATTPQFNPPAAAEKLPGQVAAQAAFQPSAQVSPQASKQSPVVEHSTESAIERAPRYEAPDFSATTSTASRIASDALLGKVQEIRPSARISPPARPISAQEPLPEVSRRAAAARAGAVPSNAAIATAADMAMPAPATFTPPPMPTRAPISQTTSPSAAPKETSASPAAPVLAASESVPARPAISTPAPAPATSTLSQGFATAEAYWRSSILQPAKDIYQNRSKLLARLPEDLRNPQFVGRTAGAGVVTAFLALLLLTSYNYLKQARAMSAAPPSQTRSVNTSVKPDEPIAPPVVSSPVSTSASTKHARESGRTATTTATSERTNERTNEHLISRRSNEPLPSQESIQADTTGNAALQLARHYLEGEDQNQALAIQWLWSSVAKGNAQADIILSEIYLRGEGVTQNCEQSRVLLRKAANSGNSEAQRRLAALDQAGCATNDAQK